LVDMEDYHKCNTDLKWYGLYDMDRWYDKFFSPETYEHPAKMSFGLLEMIIKHLEELGLIKQGDRVVDFMAGTGRTGIIAELHGYPFVAVELEEHFVNMINKNKEVLKQALGYEPHWTVIQGDARELSTLLKRVRGGTGITSPPYADMVGKQGGELEGMRIGVSQKNIRRYSWDKERQIGNFKDVGIFSPPYVSQSGGTKPAKEGVLADERLLKRHSASNLSAGGYSAGEYTPGQIGRLKDVGIFSPPYADQNKKSERHMEDIDERIKTGKLADNRMKNRIRYSSSEENIGNLRDAGIVSPPYGLGEGIGHTGKTDKKIYKEKHLHVRYGNNEKQIGNSLLDDGKQTYLQAMKQVYQEAYNSNISPLVVVTKNPTRAYKLRRLDIDTAKLLESVGYTIVDYHQAVLFEVYKQGTIDGGAFLVYQGRISFFKRKSINDGNVASDHEDIIFAVKDD